MFWWENDGSTDRGSTVQKFPILSCSLDSSHREMGKVTMEKQFASLFVISGRARDIKFIHLTQKLNNITMFESSSRITMFLSRIWEKFPVHFVFDDIFGESLCILENDDDALSIQRSNAGIIPTWARKVPELRCTCTLYNCMVAFSLLMLSQFVSCW